MRVYIFACGQTTYEECVKKGVFGTKKEPSKEWVLNIGAGDYCVLYHLEKKELQGVWQATGETGEGKFDVAWGKQFLYQAKVNQVGTDLQSLSLDKVRSNIMTGGKMHDFVENTQAEALLCLFGISSSTSPQNRTHSPSIFQPPFFETLRTTQSFEGFEDNVYLLFRLMGIHDIYSYDRNQQAGRADGFLKFENLAVLYDCSLRTDNLDAWKAQQVKNYVATLKSGQISLPPNITISVSGANCQVWIVTKRPKRLIETVDGIEVKEIDVQDLIALYERRLKDKMTAKELEIALRTI